MKAEYIILFGAVGYVLFCIGMAKVLFPKTTWREDDPCGRS